MDTVLDAAKSYPKEPKLVEKSAPLIHSVDPASTVSKKSKKKIAEGTKGGRQTGSRNFTQDNIIKIVELIQAYLPIGNEGWDLVTDQFNEWAKEHHSFERDSLGIRKKWDGVSFSRNLSA